LRFSFVKELSLAPITGSRIFREATRPISSGGGRILVGRPIRFYPFYSGLECRPSYAKLLAGKLNQIIFMVVNPAIDFVEGDGAVFGESFSSAIRLQGIDPVFGWLNDTRKPIRGFSC